jgi:hypothetical protein
MNTPACHGTTQTGGGEHHYARHPLSGAKINPGANAPSKPWSRYFAAFAAAFGFTLVAAWCAFFALCAGWADVICVAPVGFATDSFLAVSAAKAADAPQAARARERAVIVRDILIPPPGLPGRSQDGFLWFWKRFHEKSARGLRCTFPIFVSFLLQLPAKQRTQSPGHPLAVATDELVGFRRQYARKRRSKPVIAAFRRYSQFVLQPFPDAKRPIAS